MCFHKTLNYNAALCIPSASLIKRITFLGIIRKTRDLTRKKNRGTKGNRSSRRKRRSLSILQWNCEGLKSIMRLVEKDLTETADVVCLSETFLTTETRITNYQTVHQLATKNARGRASGGLTIAVRNGLNFSIVSKSDHLIHIGLPDANIDIISCYFQPNFAEEELLEHLDSELSRSIYSTIIVLGDFNSRIDSESPSIVLEFMVAAGFYLSTNPNFKTYISKQGSSCIDLCFTNKLAIIKDVELIQDPVRKHQKIRTSYKTKTIKTEKKPRYGRKVNSDKIPTDIESKIRGHLDNEDIDTASEAIGLAVRRSTEMKTPKTKWNKPWFDRECLQQKKYCLQLAAKKDPLYHLARTDYKQMLKTKSQQYLEACELEHLEECKSKPWKICVKKKLNPIPAEVDKGKLVEHLKNLYSLTSPEPAELETDRHKNPNK